MTTQTEILATVRRNLLAVYIEPSVTRVAEPQVVCRRDLGRSLAGARAKAHVAFVAPVGLAFLLGYAEVDRMLGKALVLDLGRRLDLHLIVARRTVFFGELGAFHLLVMAILA